MSPNGDPLESSGSNPGPVSGTAGQILGIPVTFHGQSTVDAENADNTGVNIKHSQYCNWSAILAG